MSHPLTPAPVVGPVAPPVPPGLDAAIEAALVAGCALAAADAEETRVDAAYEALVPEAARLAPLAIGEGAPHRPIALTALRSAIEIGYLAGKSRRAKLEGRPVPVEAPLGYEQATATPGPGFLERQTNAVLDAYRLSIEMESAGEVPPDEESEPSEPERGRGTDPDGFFRVRSRLLRDAGDGLYQLIVVAGEQQTAVFRRAVGESDVVRVYGPWAEGDEAMFIERAKREVAAWRTAAQGE